MDTGLLRNAETLLERVHLFNILLLSDMLQSCLSQKGVASCYAHGDCFFLYVRPLLC